MLAFDASNHLNTQVHDCSCLGMEPSSLVGDANASHRGAYASHRGAYASPRGRLCIPKILSSKKETQFYFVLFMRYNLNIIFVLFLNCITGGDKCQKACRGPARQFHKKWGKQAVFR